MTGIIHRLFHRHIPGDKETPMNPDNREGNKKTPTPESDRAGVPQLITGIGISVGKKREHNEDALFTLTTNLESGNTQINLGLYIVADGMGGHEHGELASENAVRVMASKIIQRLPAFISNNDLAISNDSIQEMMKESTLDAHNEVLKNVPGGGTTLTAALVLGDQVTISHIGDSRAYAITSEGKMKMLTHDHSLVMRLIELGRITPEEAAVHPQRNVLYRALGQADSIELDIITYTLPVSSYLLICSDGLWGVVGDDEISEIITTSPSPNIACQRMIEAANTAGGPDNITALLIQMPDNVPATKVVFNQENQKEISHIIENTTINGTHKGIEQNSFSAADNFRDTGNKP
ncbi:MAG: protein phosphatase 2C domain-containing protein [Anaerolineales bacterium]